MSSKQKQSYFTPYGRSMLTVDEYLQQWGDLLIPLQEHLDMTTLSFNPTVSLMDNTDNNLTVQLPLWFAKRLIGWQHGND